MTHITIHVGFHALRSGWVMTHSISCLNVRLSIKWSTLGMLVGPKDPIPLCDTLAWKRPRQRWTWWRISMIFLWDLIRHWYLIQLLQARMLVAGVRVLPCMGPLEGTGDPTQCPHCWPVCLGLIVRRRCRIPNNISSPMAVSSWSR